jgi:hypothetical protein
MMKRRWHTPMERCAFCQQVDLIYETAPVSERERLFIELFDRADRASRARRAYGRKRRGWRP